MSPACIVWDEEPPVQKDYKEKKHRCRDWCIINSDGMA
jgi:hypothetical protein